MLNCLIYKNGKLKSCKLLNDSDSESSKFATKKWYVINDQNNTEYAEGNENDSNTKFETKLIKSSVSDYSDAYVIVTGNILATNGNADNKVAFKNYAPFTRCVTHINNELVETAENLDVIMPLYNLIEYSGNYADTSGTLYQLKRDE